jgi:putative N-acetylmannosamine-6-phosphate epimerase
MLVEQDQVQVPIILVVEAAELPLLVVIMPLLQQVEQVEQEQIYVLLFQEL